MTDPNQPGGYGATQPPATPQEAKARAKAEKAYRKASRPFYKKKRVLIPLALVVLIGIVVSTSGGGGDDDPDTVAAATSCEGKTYPDQQASDICADGSNAVVFEDVTVTAQPFETQDDSFGGKALCSAVSILNTSDESQDYNVFDFKVQTPSGDVASTGVANFAGTLNSGAIIKGATKEGLVCTDDTGETGMYVFIYKPNAFSDDRGILLFNV